MNRPTPARYLALLASFWIGSMVLLFLFRLYATVGIAAHHYVGLLSIGKSIFFGMGNDLLTSLFVTLVFSPFVVLVFRLTGGKVLTSLLFPFLLLAGFCFALERYFIGEMTPLGADFWSYSAADISETVSSSIQLDATLRTGALLFVTGLVASLLISRKVNMHFSRKHGMVFIFSIVASIPLAVISSRFANLQDQQLSTNRLAYFVYHSVYDGRVTDAGAAEEIPEYPFEQPSPSNDVLSQYFESFSAPPNLVFIQVEGLGGQFVGGGILAGFTPFLDSLAQKSLFWPNCLSTTGRTFGVVPALYGSLPYGDQGFMDLGPNYPAHFTLISWLKSYGYSTSYYYGGNINFDKTDIFLEAQGIGELIYEGKFPDGYEKMTANAEGFSWGYPDKALFDYYARTIEGEQRPRLDMLMTVTMHEPFKVPEPSIYQPRFEKIAASLGKKEPFATYRNIFETLLYFDDALSELFRKLAARDDWENTMVIITGDHRVIPLPQEGPLDRFHVPLVIWSPAIKQPHTFRAAANHAQVTPSLVAFFKNQFQYQTAERLPFIGRPLSTSADFESTMSLPLMRNKGELDMYVDNDLLLAGNRLFRVADGLKTEPYNHAGERKRLQSLLATFRRKQQVALSQNRLWSYESQPSAQQFALSDSANSWLKKNRLHEMVADSQFYLARRLAASEQYERARWVASYLLNNSPNYSDARLLVGRSYAWEGNYQQAFAILREAQRRHPGYEDVYLALADAYYWAGKTDSSLLWVNEGMKRFASSRELKEKKERLGNENKGR